MKMLSAVLALGEGNPQVDSPLNVPLMQSFAIFFVR